MNCRPRRSNTFLKTVCSIMKRLRPALALAGLLVILALFVSATAAQKEADPLPRNPARGHVGRPRVLPQDDASQDINHLYRRYTIQLAPDCSPEPLRAYLIEMFAAGLLKQPPLETGDQIGIVVEEARAHDLTAVPCVLEVNPGWQLAAPDQSDMVSDQSEAGAEQPASAAGTGHITGTVTAESSGAGLSGISACADFYNGSFWQSAGCDTSDVDGDYDISGLEAGTHRVSFSDPNGDYASEFYDDVQDEDDATGISVTAGGTTSGINAALAERGHISGSVKAEVGGVPLSDIYVCAYLRAPNGSWQAWIGCEYTDAQGLYDIGLLPGGVYRVEFFDPGGVYLREYFDGAADIDSGTDVIVSEGSTTSAINATLAYAGHISGTVTAEFDGAPLEFIDVCAFYYDGALWRSAGCGTTDAAGFYDIGGLATGVYRVSFADLDNEYYLTEFYDDAPDIESGLDVAVTAGITTASINAALAEPGHISGTVTIDPGGAALEAVEVCAFTFDGVDWVDAGCDVTDVAGGYNIGGLPPGVYRVRFSDLFEVYVREFYDDVLHIEDAADVAVSSGMTTEGINAALILGGEITGTITAEGGSPPLRDIAACAYLLGSAGWQWYGCGYSEADGGYTISGLATGLYRVEYYDWYYGVYHGEFYDNAADLGSATDIPVLAGSTTAGIHAALVEFGHITGTVTDQFSAAPLENIEVCVYFDNGSNWEWLHCTYSNANGGYDIGGLSTGLYRLGFVDFGSVYLAEFYDDARDLDTATDIAVTVGGITAGIDAALRDYGHISGRVTGAAGGAPLANVRVCSYSYQFYHWRAGNCTDTDANGDYDIGGLAAADYRVGFFDSSGGYLFEYYDDSPDVNSAADLAVADDATISGIDAALTGQTPSPPANDDIDSALVVSSDPYQSIVDVRHATIAADDPDLTCGPKDQGYGSVWYAVTPAQMSSLRANTFGSNYGTVLNIWEGTRGNLVAMNCSDTALGAQSQTTAGPLAGGVTYYVEVVGYGSDLRELVLNLDLVSESPFAGCVSNTGSSASINIPAGVLVNGLTLAAGDEFALITPDGSLCAGQGAWTSSGLNITAWGDDPQTPEVDGFIEGNAIKFLIWDFSSEKIYIATDVTYSFTSHGLDTFKAGENFVVASLDVAPRIVRRIPMDPGWNMISSFVDPEYPDLETVMADIENQMVLMKNGAGEVYWPDQTINNIGDWDVRDGYQVYMESSATLIITGVAVEPEQTPLDLPAGWSTIAYLRNSSMPVEQALGTISGQLVVAKNGRGEVYWPAYLVNQIGDMQPRDGYQVYLSAGGTLTYPAND